MTSDAMEESGVKVFIFPIGWKRGKLRRFESIPLVPIFRSSPSISDDSSAGFAIEVPGGNSALVVQEFQWATLNVTGRHMNTQTARHNGAKNFSKNIVLTILRRAVGRNRLFPAGENFVRVWTARITSDDS